MNTSMYRRVKKVFGIVICKLLWECSDAQYMGWLTCKRASIVVSTSSSLPFSSRISLNVTPLKLGSLKIKSDGEGLPFKNSLITSTTDCSQEKQNCSSLAPQNDIQWEVAVNQIVRRPDTIPYSCPQILIEFWPHIRSCNYPLQDHKLMYMWLVVTLKDSCLIVAMSKYGQQTYVLQLTLPLRYMFLKTIFLNLVCST